jgi:N-methylhydantoinase B
MEELVAKMGVSAVTSGFVALITYGEQRMRQIIYTIPNGCYTATEYLDDDGVDTTPLAICVTLTVADDTIHIDFSGSAPQCRGPLNAPQAVTESAVLYALRLLDGDDMPASAGVYRPLTWNIPSGSILNPLPPAAVAGGNVETSQRVVDAMLAALAQAIPTRIPAQSAGTMNNWTMGGMRHDHTPFAYYETLGGGMGARSTVAGLDAVQTHMTNTRNTPVEAFERLYPVRVTQLAIRRDSGGLGLFKGGAGLCKSIQFLVPVTVTLLTERRHYAPRGTFGGSDGACGQNMHSNAAGESVPLPGKGTFELPADITLHLLTPGGGGYGEST